jgi:hypothetical protein
MKQTILAIICLFSLQSCGEKKPEPRLLIDAIEEIRVGDIWSNPNKQHVLLAEANSTYEKYIYKDNNGWGRTFFFTVEDKKVTAIWVR